QVSSVEAWAFKNTALAAQTYILACTARGLATCPMEGYDARRVRNVLSIPSRYGVPLVVATGHPFVTTPEAVGLSEGVTPQQLSWRFPSEEVVFDGSFGV
ncbi:unnamed protein product, partial [Choristocarpus tenellus]